ncbi:response regulator [Catenovulum maritimum]|uniref:histidine kinase n=1 Tax=Catenovulum maritimum TaxID=1513271 RepID=A0A0J8GT83_9ALTE|nr:response regulator [Catenovulum maritimum]KMT65962.1 hypothetical protein XM47_05760 [Catenovulum maritimum]
MTLLLSRTLISALLYFFLAQLGLQLAIPPGFASAIWPAAGLALALCLVWHPRILAGVFVGSVASNLFVVETIQIESILIALGIGVGCCLQAFVGYQLLNKLTINNKWILSPIRIRSFIIKAGPISCLVSASIGSLTLLASQQIEITAFSFTWLTWWIGDMLGCLFITPLLLIFFHKEKHQSKFKISQVVAPSVLIFSLVIIVFSFNKNDSIEKANQELVADNQKLALQFEKELERYLIYLRAFKGFYLGSNFVDSVEFNTYASNLIKSSDAIQTISWVPRVPRGKQEEFISQISAQHNRAIKISQLTNITTTQDLFPIAYCFSPRDGSEQYLGINVSSEKNRLETLTRAWRLNQVSLSKAVLSNDKLNQSHFYSGYLFTPLFLNSLNQERQNDNLIGFLVLEINYQRLFDNLIKTTFNPSQINHYSFTITAASGTKVYQLGDIPAANIKSSYSINKVGQQWSIDVTSKTIYLYNRKDWQSWSILVFGALITIMLQIFILWLTSNNNHIAKQVKVKTRSLSQAKSKAEQATLQKSYFLANMSHELRTPLNAIMGLADILKSSQLTEQQNEKINKISQASHTLLSLISDILDVTKIESGKIELELSPFSLTSSLNKINALFQEQMEKKGLSFKITYTEQNNHWFVGDSHRIEQILMNLCGNAIKFTEQGGISIIVEQSKYDAGKSLIQFRVVDTGIGIEQNRLKAIFDSFVQEDSSITRQYGGSGLGLSICRKLVTLMGSELTCDSKKGIGSRFCFELILPHADIVSTSEIDPVKEKAQAVKNLENKQVLIAEDNDINQQIIAYQMEALGAKLSLANNGQEAVNLVQSNKFDLILMDIQMPVLDGISATRQILELENGHSTPIIAMTANVSVQDKQACFEAGMQAHIGKPFDVVKLHQVLNKALGNNINKI